MEYENKITIKGDVLKLEFKEYSNGNRLAILTVFTEGQGFSKIEQEWHTCKAWGDLSDYISDNIVIGDKVEITGKLRYVKAHEQKLHLAVINVIEICNV